MKRPLAFISILGLLLPSAAWCSDPFGDVQITNYFALTNGFTGARTVVAQVEAGGVSPLTNHDIFTGKTFTFGPSVGGAGQHAMTVGSIFYGNGTNYHGAGFGATNIYIYEPSWFFNNVIGAISNIPAKVINQSFLFTVHDPVIDNYYDLNIELYGKIIVNGAGNSSAYGSNTNSPATFYNGITVGGVNEQGAGPGIDGRSKPDLVAPTIATVGTATNASGFQSSQPGTDGTSDSAPFVAGAAAILVDRALGTPALSNGTDPRVVKSILMTSAKKLAGWTRGTNGVADPSAIPLDWKQGAGELQVLSAFNLMSAGQFSTGSVGYLGWDLNNITQSQVTSYTLNLTNHFLGSNYSLTATLDWYSHPITATSNLLLNLDLRLWSVTNGVDANLMQMSTSMVDNVEHLYLPNLAAGDYRFEINSLATNPAGIETYAFSWQAIAVPEPSASLLLLLGAVSAVRFLRRDSKI